MTALPLRAVRVPLARSFMLGAALGLAVIARWAATVQVRADGLLTGLVFGLLLLGLAVAAGWRAPTAGWTRPATIHLASVGAGLAVGLGLVALALVGGRGDLPGLRPAAPFLPWVVVTALVASAEEIVLRGVLFDVLEEHAGAAPAILVTALAFALIHVPFYGWQVLPLDLGVGLVFGGLRLLSGGVTAPAVAHVIADLATWWI